MIKLFCSALLAMACLLSPCAPTQAAPQKTPKAPLLAPQNVPPAPSFGNPNQQRIPSILQNPELPLAPFAEYFVDATGKMVVEDLVKDGMSQKFSPLHPSKIKGKSGVLWIRLVLSPSHLESGTPPPVFLDLGNAPAPAIYTLEAPLENAEPEWREKACSERLLALPLAEAETEKPIFLRFDTLPGRWFAPTLRTAENAATNYTAYYRAAGIVSLCVLMLVCLLSAFVEAGSWRLWALLYLAAVGTQAFAGAPAANGFASVLSSAAKALPGLCVFLYPQAARHLLRCPQEARFLNAQFVLLSLAGLALAALPFIPQLGWASRYIDCWPLALAIFVPTALFGLIYRRPGAGRLLLGSALPPIAVALAWFCASSDRFSPEFMGALPLWGTVLGALLVTGLPCKAPTPCPQADLNIDAPDNAPQNAGKAGTPLSLGSQPAQKSALPGKDASSQPLGLEPQGLSMGKPEALSLSVPIQNGLPPLGGGQKDAGGLSLDFDPAQSVQPQPASARPVSSAAPAFEDEQDEAIDESASVTLVNLKELLLRAKDTAQMHALNSRCQLQWSTTQQIDSLYEGPAQLLLKTLDVCCKELCLKQGSLATFSFSHAPESEGKDLFAVALTGQNQFSRHALAYARKLSAESAGTMRLDCGKQESTLRFTVRFSPARQRTQQQSDTLRSPLLQPDQSKTTGPTLEMLLLADSPQVSVRILSLLKNLPAHVRLAARAEDLLSQQRNAPAHMVVIQGKAATPSAAPLIKAILASTTPPVSILAYTVDDSTWNDLALAGFTHALTLPIEQSQLLETFSEVMAASFPQGSEARRQDVRRQSGRTEQAPQAAPRGEAAVQPAISLEKKDAAPDTAGLPSEGKNGEDAPGATRMPQGNAAFQKSRISFYLEQAKRCLGYSKMSDLAIAAATIAAIAAQEKLEDASRLAGVLTKAARDKDEEKAKEALSALSSILNAQK